MDVKKNDKNQLNRKKNERTCSLVVVNETSLLKMVRKIKPIGHIIRHNNFLNNIMERTILGKGLQCAPRQSYFKNIRATMNFTSYHEMKRKAANRGTRLFQQGVEI